jgi:hypothetical protein
MPMTAYARLTQMREDIERWKAMLESERHSGGEDSDLRPADAHDKRPVHAEQGEQAKASRAQKARLN